jgi:outer membrane protein assembly factor BamB
MKKPLMILVWWLAVCTLDLGLRAEDWPQFLGPRSNGISSETGLLDRWPTNGPPILWEKAIGTGYSAPSVRGDLLVLHHRFRNEEIVEAFQAATGDPVWRYAYPSEFIDPYGYNNGPRSSPLLTADRCYTFGAEGKLLCLELQTGKLVWQRDTGNDWDVPPAFFGVGSSPVLEGGLLLVMVGGQLDSGMVAFDPQTGKTVWESVGKKNWSGQPMIGWPGERTVIWNPIEKQASYATPVVATVHGQRVAFCLMRQGLVGLNPKNGEVHFSFWFRSRLNDSVNAANPIVLDDAVLISGAYGKVGSVLLKVKPDLKSVEEMWRDPVLEIHWSTPILYNGYLYAFSGRNEPDARFRCVEFKTGKLMWDRDESWPGRSIILPKTFGRGSLILADGKLIAFGECGRLGLFALNPQAPQEISSFQVPRTHYPSWTGPVLSNRRLFLRTEDRLTVLDLGKK